MVLSASLRMVKEGSMGFRPRYDIALRVQMKGSATV